MSNDTREIQTWDLSDVPWDAEPASKARLVLLASRTNAKRQTEARGSSVRAGQDKGLESLTEAPEALATEVKTLYLDIETRPNLMYVWDVWDKQPNNGGLVEPHEVICWAAKWKGEKKIHYCSVFHHGKHLMLKKIHDLLSEADIVKTYNGKRFDIPRLNTEFLLAGFTPPAPYQHSDLYVSVKRTFGFTYNSLAYVSKMLNLSGKKKSPGFDNWLGCMKNDESSWQEMMSYNIQDVVVLEELDEKLLPWSSPHPSHAAILDKNVCPKCGSSNIQRRGYAYTSVSTYQRWACISCGAWSRSSTRDSGVTIREMS